MFVCFHNNTLRYDVSENEPPSVKAGYGPDGINPRQDRKCPWAAILITEISVSDNRLGIDRRSV